MTGFFTAPRIAWGTGAIEQLSGLSARKAVVVVDPALAPRDFPKRVVEELKKSETSVELLPAPEVPDSTPGVERLAERLRAHGPDWIVAVGGGRTIDGAKAARLLLERPGVTLGTVTPLLDLPDPFRARLAAVPTTSGSGSEASGTVDLWTADGVPFEIAHRALTPDWALVDPASAASLSAELLLDGALETAAQAFEAYLSAWSNPYSDALAVDAFTTVLARLPHALRWSDDPDAKAALHYAATAAGLASSNAQRGVGHALARALVRPTDRSYGRLLGLLLPHLLEFDRPSARERIEALSAATNREENGSRVPLPNRLARLYDTFQVPGTLAAAGVDRPRVEAARTAIVSNALRSPAVLANPRVPSAADLEGLLDRLLGG
ncbi:MAG TPA: iron-containing alcohol dehydrogenase [Thermoplasmata archaeon]|nr:iron-containing alcohol dehydrogenase [Thermoplasmata archaeon]